MRGVGGKAGGVGAGRGGGRGDQALIIIKGPMIYFLHHLEEHGSHLNEYQINTLKSLQRALDCHVQFMQRNKPNTSNKRKNKMKCEECDEARDVVFSVFFLMCI